MLLEWILEVEVAAGRIGGASCLPLRRAANAKSVSNSASRKKNIPPTNFLPSAGHGLFFFPTNIHDRDGQSKDARPSAGRRVGRETTNRYFCNWQFFAMFLTFALQTSIPSPTFEATMLPAMRATRAPTTNSPQNTMCQLGTNLAAHLQLKRFGF